MKSLKILLKVFVSGSILAAIIIGSIAVYMNLYGNAHIKKALSELAGAKVDFSGIAINLSNQAASFKGFSVASEIGFDKNIFAADTFTVVINKEKLEKEKRIVFDRVYVKGADLYIIRNSNGRLNMALPKITAAKLTRPVFDPEDVAYADDIPAKNGLYEILKVFGNIRVEDSVITFEDHFKTSTPYKIWCESFFMDIVSNDTGQGYLSTTLVTRGRIPQRQGGDGWFAMKASIAIYPDKTNMELTAETGNVDMMVFLPYFQRSTPFFFRSGRFNSRTNFRMHDGWIDSLTTMQFRNLNLVINAYAPNAQFMSVSINRLAPYLMSGGNLVFDFVLKGDARNPQFDVGPRVKYAIGMVTMEEVAKVVQQIQMLQK